VELDKECWSLISTPQRHICKLKSSHSLNHDPFPAYIRILCSGCVLVSAMSCELTFGPAGQEWHYSPSTKTYDLSGGSASKMTIGATEGPKGTCITINPETTVLVIVDMQNFFLDQKCTEHPNGLNAVEPTIRTIEKCRELGIQVASPHENAHRLMPPDHLA
jgi:hypothetical protein